MPELPEVETVVQDLIIQKICGCTIKTISITWPRIIDKLTPDDFAKAVQDKTVTQISRRGKYIIILLSDQSRIFIHLRMTGKIQIQPNKFKTGKHDHVVFSLSDGRKLVFNDTRKFGRITLTKDGASPASKLGPEPLGKYFSKTWLQESLARRSRRMKPLLLDQSFIAGLGNIYVDEALWQAKIHPERISNTITKEEANALHKAIQTVLKRGIKNCGTTLGKSESNFYSVAGRRGRNADQLKVFRRTGEPCPLCHTTIERLIVGQRSTHICPQCQRL